MCLTGAFSDMQKYRHNYNSCTTTTGHILTIVKYRKAFMMQVQKDALTSAASFSCLQLVRNFQEEDFKRCSCVFFSKTSDPDSCSKYTKSGTRFHFLEAIVAFWDNFFSEELWLAWGGAFDWLCSLKQFSILTRWFSDLKEKDKQFSILMRCSFYTQVLGRGAARQYFPG